MTVAEFVLPHTLRSDRSSPGRWILSHVARHGWIVLMMVVGAISNAALAGVVPIFVGRAFNLILADPAALPELATIAVWIVVSQVVRSALQMGRNFGAELIGQRLERDIRDELYASLLGKSMTFHSLQPVGDTMARATNDVREVNLMFNPGLNLVVGSAIFLVIPPLYAPAYHPALAIIPTLFIIAYGFALWQYLAELRPITERARQAFGTMNAHLAEALDGVEVVKGAAQETEEVGRFSANAAAHRDAFVQQGNVEARFLPFLLMVVAQAAGLAHALILFGQGAIDVGAVVAYMGLLFLFGFPTFVSLFAYSQVSLGMASARRILELITRTTELDRNRGGHTAPIRGEIEFRNVDFSYPAGEPVLAGVSFRVPPGQTVAIVGQTGAGKTSLAKLINRIHDVQSGAVLVDGVDVRAWDLAGLRRQISIIEQDVFLFSRSLGENIAFGRPDSSQAEIEAAARLAQAHEFILGFHDGYQTRIGERGVTLSGGQRQRVALARAFLADPRILILDDSTSSIDSATEDEIQRAIFRAAQGRTTILITHRLSQIRWADLIVVLRQGRIVAQGKHDELLQSSEAYRRIFSRLEE